MCTHKHMKQLIVKEQGNLGELCFNNKQGGGKKVSHERNVNKPSI